MDTQPEETKPISDDQELAKALAGISSTNDGMQFEETPVATPAPVAAQDTPAENATEASEEAPDLNAAPAAETEPAVEQTSRPEVELVTPSDDLGSIKKDALLELRPLVDKLELSAEERFDIYLLLLRSTDDKTLIEPAHEAARNIADETRKAQALLDVIKEIDYLSNPQQ